MSDPRAPDLEPDPMDKAYAQAEAMLSDEAARAARRARVLAAVAGEAAAPTPAPAVRRPLWRRGGWLVAASVAGLSVLIATQVSPPPRIAPPYAPQGPVPAAPPPPQAEAAAPKAPPVAQTPPLALAKPAPAVRRTAPSPLADVAQPPPAPTMQAAPAPAPPPPTQVAEARAAPAGAAPPSSLSINELVVTAEKRVAPKALAPVDRPQGLREAAAEGRVADLATLLALKAPVDAADEDGETALMKAVQANQPAAAAYLRRHGASLDLKNKAGASARDMARDAGDPKLDKALGIKR